LIQSKTNHFTLPIIFCIDNHALSINENNHNTTKPPERLSLDEEFDMTNEENEEESNNSFIYTLCERLAEEFTFKHIHYGDFNKILLNFDQLKTLIIESMSACAGYIIDHFPTSYDDLQKFEKEVKFRSILFFIEFPFKIGPCSTLIYIGEHQIDRKDDELNGIIEKFKQGNKAIYVNKKKYFLHNYFLVFYLFKIDCRMEVDEIYEDLKKDIFKHI
jgi:hypothetical protein